MSGGRRCGSAQKRRLKRNLLTLQGGRCFWCGRNIHLDKDNGRFSDWLATLDHLDERDSPNRGRFTNVMQRRRVLACLRCNNDRAAKPLPERLLMADQAAWSLQREHA